MKKDKINFFKRREIKNEKGRIHAIEIIDFFFSGRKTNKNSKVISNFHLLVGIVDNKKKQLMMMIMMMMISIVIQRGHCVIKQFIIY